MNETIEGLRNKFKKLKEAYKSKGLNVNLGKTKMTVNGNITKDGFSYCKLCQCGALQHESKGQLSFWVQHGKWIQ